LPWAPTVERQLEDLAITPGAIPRGMAPSYLDEYGDSLSAAGRALGERVKPAGSRASVAKFFAATRTLVHYRGARGAALAAAMTTRLFQRPLRVRRGGSDPLTRRRGSRPFHPANHF
jgi:hypothetical protein